MIFTIDTIFVVAILAIFSIAYTLWRKKSSYRLILNRHVVITGGSSGIGLSIAIHCVKLGAHVTIIARNEKKLETAVEKIKSHRVNDKQLIQSRLIDLAKSSDAVKELFDTLGDEIAPIYWLINCAGGVMRGRIIDHLFSDDDVYLMNVKYYAVYYPTRIMWTKMKSMGEGIITIIGSEAKDLVMEYYGHGPFGTCKLSSNGLAETINMKGSHSKISITLALVEHTVNLVNIKATDNQEAQSVPKNDDLVQLDKMAHKIVRDSLNGKFVSVSGWENWLLVTVWKVGRLLRAILHCIQRFYSKKYGKLRAQINTFTDSKQLPPKPIDSEPSKLNSVEKDSHESFASDMHKKSVAAKKNTGPAVPVILSDSNPYHSTCADNRSQPQKDIKSEDHATDTAPESTTADIKEELMNFSGSSNVEKEADKIEENSNPFEFNFGSSTKQLESTNSFATDSLDNASKMATTAASSGDSMNLVSSSSVESTTNSNAQDKTESSKFTDHLLKDFKITSKPPIFVPANESNISPSTVLYAAKSTSNASSAVHDSNPFAVDAKKPATATKAISFNPSTVPSFGFSAPGSTSFGFSLTQPKTETTFGITSKIPVIKSFGFSSSSVSNPFESATENGSSNLVKQDAKYPLEAPLSFNVANKSDEKSIIKETTGSETTGKNPEGRKPLFSFNRIENKNVTGEATTTEKGKLFSFDANKFADTSQPFMFGAKTDDKSNESDSSDMNLFQITARPPIKRFK